MTTRKPRVALTMGDVAGIGPEICVRACADPDLFSLVEPIVVGHPEVLRRAVKLLHAELDVTECATFADATSTPNAIACLNPGADAAAEVLPATVDARAGQAAYDYLIAAGRAALAGEVDAIVTAPLNKAALSAAGLDYPGHTEILGELCGVQNFGMMLYMPACREGDPQANPSGSSHNLAVPVASPHGLGVVHVTLHTSIRSVPDLLTTEGVLEKIGLMDEFMRAMGCDPPRLGVCALNPHGGEGGLFGDEEGRIIAPAVAAAVASGLRAVGPLPADTLMQRACAGEFDGVIAMYHDQGHIALKLLGFESAVNVTLGLPIVRTSPSHGTAFDIAWQGAARMDGMQQAVRVAAMLAQRAMK